MTGRVTETVCFAVVATSGDEEHQTWRIVAVYPSQTAAVQRAEQAQAYTRTKPTDRTLYRDVDGRERVKRDHYDAWEKTNPFDREMQLDVWTDEAPEYSVVEIPWILDGHE